MAVNGDKRFVCEHWVRAEACPHPHTSWCCISLGGRAFTRVTVPNTISGYADNEEEAWAAAAKFTRERLDSIREREEAVAILEQQILRHKIADLGLEALRQQNNGKWLRILAREEEALADLKRGMK